jgi:myo-inositol-1(or 4)-monophosphatase
MNIREWTRNLAITAGTQAQAMRNQGVTRQRKSHQDFVTAADKEIEQLIRRNIQREFPDDLFFGEETGEKDIWLEGKNGVWVVDPIDGTSNYASGLDAWCISIARVTVAGIEVAAIAAPDRGEVYCAEKGGGTRRNETPLDLSSIPPVPVTEALIMTGKGAEITPDQYLSTLRKLFDRGFEYRRYGSGALGIAMVSTGAIQGYIETGMHIWDIAAAHLIVQEARGFCSRFPVNPLTIKPGPPLVVCQPGLEHELMLVLNR